VYGGLNVASQEHEREHSEVIAAQIKAPLYFLKRMREIYAICSAHSDRSRKAGLEYPAQR